MFIVDWDIMRIGEIRFLEYGALSITAKAFRQRGNEKAGRRDKDFANG